MKLEFLKILATITLLSGTSTEAFAAQCDTSSDCLDHETCQTQTTLDCGNATAPSCEEGESDADCTERTDDWRVKNCTESNRKECLPAWIEACDESKDCGNGFTCEGTTCQPEEIECSSVSDCPSAWSCPESKSSENLCMPPPANASGGAPAQDNDAGDTETKESTEATDESGCSLSGGPSAPFKSTPLMVTLLLGAMLLLRKRRKN